MSELKTKLNDENVEKFLNSVADETKRKDSFAILDMMQEATGLQPKMWGTAIVGFGNYHYIYESGHEGDMCIIGFSPRKQNFALYVGASNQNIQQLLINLGKHKTGKGCLYVTKLSDIDNNVLKKIFKVAFDNNSNRK